MWAKIRHVLLLASAQHESHTQDVGLSQHGNSAFWPVLVSIEKSNSEKLQEADPDEIYSPASGLLW